MVNYVVPYEIARDLMKARALYANLQRDYVKLYERWYCADKLNKKFIQDRLDREMDMLEFTWNELCEYDGQLHACAEMLGVSRFSFFQVVRIFKKVSNDWPESPEIERIVNSLNDGVYYTGTYNGMCLSPEEFRRLLWRGEWSKVR